MKILYIQETDWLNKGPQQQHHLFERLASQGDTVVVVDYDILWREQLKNGFIAKRILKQPPLKTSTTISKNLLLVRPKTVRIPILNYFSVIITYGTEIYRIIKQFEPDVVVGAGMLAVTVGQIIASANSVPFVYLTVDKLHTLIPSQIFQPFGLALESRLAKKSSYNVVINEQLKEYKIRIGAKREKTAVIRAGVSLELFNPDDTTRKSMRKNLGYCEADRVLFFMGWLYRFSGLKEIVEEMARDKNPNIKLCIVGKGDLLDDLNDLRQQMKLTDRIKIIPWVKYTELANYLSIADICLLPAYKNATMDEIVPIKLYEYLAMKKPVLTTKLKGIMREFKATNGVLYCENSRAVYYQAIQLSNVQIADLGKRGRDFIIQNCDWVQLTKKFKIILETL